MNPASTTVTSSIDIPTDAEVSYGGSVIAIAVAARVSSGVSPRLATSSSAPTSTPPLLELGEGAHAVVTPNGAILAVSPEQGAFYRVPTLSDAPIQSSFPKVGEFQLAAVGEQAAVFDQSTNEVLNESGAKYTLGGDVGMRLQQSGGPSDFAIVATGDGLMRVNLGSGAIERIGAGIDEPTTGSGGGCRTRQSRGLRPWRLGGRPPLPAGLRGPGPAAAGHRAADRGQPPRVPGQPQRDRAQRPGQRQRRGS